LLKSDENPPLSEYLIQVLDCEADKSLIFTVDEYFNQGNLSDYLAKRKALGGKSLNEKDASFIMKQFLDGMSRYFSTAGYHGTLHLKNIFVNSGMVKLGDPLFVNEKIEKKMRDLRGVMD